MVLYSLIRIYILVLSCEPAEAVAQTCSVKKVFLENLQNSQESTCARVSFLMKLQAAPATGERDSGTGVSCEFCEISKNTFFFRTPLVAASELVNSMLFYMLQKQSSTGVL